MFRKWEILMRGYFPVGLALCAFVTSIVAVRADDIPRLNIAPLCHGIVNQGADPLQVGDPNVSYEMCIKAEKTDRDQLAKEWSTFSPADKKNCVAEAMMGGESSYTDLMTCLEM